MTEDVELSQLMQNVAEKSLDFINKFNNPSEQSEDFIRQFTNLTTDYLLLLNSLLANPDKIFEMQIAYFKDAMTLAQEQMQHWLNGETMPFSDRRFYGEEWVKNPLFNLMGQHYLLATEHMNALLDKMTYEDPRTARRIKFFARQMLDALSPTNFLHTNPQLLAETIQSHGKNLLAGLKNLLSDLDSGSNRLIIKMTDTKAFQVGKNIGITPGKVIYRNAMMELIQYTPQTAKVNAVPLLMIPPWINKYYILDLSPENSLVNWLTGQGITVFMISWVNPDSSYADKGLYDYMQEGPQTAISIIQKQLGVKKVNTLGFCIGGTLLACLLAYNKAKGLDCIQSATFLASMIDFSEPGDISVFIDEKQIATIEETMKNKGYLEGRFMASTFNSLRANDLIWSFFVKNYLQGKDPVPFDILYWNADTTNMPAKMHSTYLRRMYLHNDLIKPNKINFNGVGLDITQITTPCFFLSTIKDHIAPWETVYLGYQLMKGSKTFVLGGSGHIAGIVNSPAKQKYGYYTNPQTDLTAEEWLRSAEQHAGSWWPEWLKWLKKQSGRLIGAPALENLPMAGMRDAPGEYVLQGSFESE